MHFKQRRAPVARWNLREHHTKHLLCARPWGLEHGLKHYFPRSGINTKDGTPAVCLGAILTLQLLFAFFPFNDKMWLST